MVKQCQTLFWGAPKSWQMVTAAMKLKDAYSLEGKLWPTETAYSKAETLLYHQSPSSQGYGFSSGHVWMWELDYKESWALNNWCFWTVVLEKTLESTLDCKEIQPVHPKGNQPWIFIGRTDAEAETPILWPPDVNHWLFRKDSDAGKDWRYEKWTIKNAMLDAINDSMGMSLSKLWKTEKDREAWCAAFHGITKSWTWLNDWTTSTTVF